MPSGNNSALAIDDCMIDKSKLENPIGAEPPLLPFDSPRQWLVSPFVTAGSNLVAAQILAQWPEPNQQGLAQLAILIGSNGSGKRLLLHQWLERQPAITLHHGEIQPWLARIHQQKQLAAQKFALIDLVEDYLAPQESSGEMLEQELFRFINLIVEQNGCLLMVSRKNPAAWRIKLPDLQSRLNAATVMVIEAADEELLKKLVARFCQTRQVQIDAEVIDYLMRRIVRSGEELLRWLELLNQYSLRYQRPITISLARELLGDYQEQLF